MKTIFSIFFNDIRSVVTHLFAFAIAIALCVLPALYAWINIYANTNPYVNTGNIPFAFASRDKGIDLETGEHVNSADEIMDYYRDSTSIGWRFVDDADAAIAGVESGEYYAAIIFEDNFTYNMYHIEETLKDGKAPLTYYENNKANAIAPKITDTAAKNVLERINTIYVKNLVAQFFGDTSELLDEIQDEDVVDETIARLKSLRDTLNTYDTALEKFTSGSSKTHKALENTESNLERNRNSNARAITRAKKNLDEAKASLARVQESLEADVKNIQTQTDKIKEQIDSIDTSAAEEEQEKIKNAAIAETDVLIDYLTSLREYADTLNESEISGADAIGTAVDLMLVNANGIRDALNGDLIDKDQLTESLTLINSINNTSLLPSIKAMISRMDSTVKMLEPLANSVSGLLDDIDPIIFAADDTITSLDLTLLQLQSVVHSAADRLDELIDELESAEADEQLQMIIDFLGGDPDRYANFLSSLVNVEVQEIYPIASYGAAMAPFYTVLAIWVGGVFLVSILKTSINREKFPKATEAQSYFGRLLIFLLIGQIQAAVIVTGDIKLLGCAPVEPGRMYLAAAIASIVFVTLIYSLTLAFGDVGKAIVIVVMVVQIAGSSGSYPIEILPPIFGKMYKFFPFPYAINAIREAICGSYGNDYWIYLSELGIFLVLAIVIGLMVRRRFIGMHNFVTEKLEESEVL